MGARIRLRIRLVIVFQPVHHRTDGRVGLAQPREQEDVLGVVVEMARSGSSAGS
jgi:hypothetical protein